MERSKNQFKYIAVAILLLSTGLIFTGYIIYFKTALKIRASKVLKCSDFSSQIEAQKAYDLYINDPIFSKYVKGLDANHNGKVCESKKYASN